MKKAVEPEADSICITRIDYGTFELSDGITKARIKRGQMVPKCPRCFQTINALFAAAKAANCILDHEDC